MISGTPAASSSKSSMAARNARIVETLLQESRGNRVLREGDTVAEIPRGDECAFGCERCRFVVFNSNIKSNELGFTPSHACPGHLETRVGCCVSNNFQGWRDCEHVERNVLNHVFGIKRNRPSSFCAEVLSMTNNINQENAAVVLVEFRNGETLKVDTSRLPDDLRSTVLERFEHFVTGASMGNLIEGNDDQDDVPGSHSSDVKDEHRQLRMPESACSSKVGTRQPTSVQPTPQLTRKTSMKAAPSNTLSKRARPSSSPPSQANRFLTPPPFFPSTSASGNEFAASATPATSVGSSSSSSSIMSAAPTKRHSSDAPNIPDDWPFYPLWKDNLDEFERAKEAWIKAKEMREMLLAALDVFNRNRNPIVGGGANPLKGESKLAEMDL